ncbi:hypothetical protein OPV22_003737 [Ensete ventricosum]|uniref:Uncharacterized protein n=2 Tax=Ensete ventricosum TaxID=4639 RepID=A0AAV8S1E2_ENSVE|nr:hypothetical protein OPV22_003737 [Ensete ventricosum]
MAALRLWTGESSRAWEDMGAALLPPQWSSHNRGVGAVGAADHSQLSGGGLDMDGPRSFDCSTLPCLTHQGEGGFETAGRRRVEPKALLELVGGDIHVIFYSAGPTPVGARPRAHEEGG